MLGFGPLGQFALGQQPIPAPTLVALSATGFTATSALFSAYTGKAKLFGFGEILTQATPNQSGVVGIVGKVRASLKARTGYTVVLSFIANLLTAAKALASAPSTFFALVATVGLQIKTQPAMSAAIALHARLTEALKSLPKPGGKVGISAIVAAMIKPQPHLGAFFSLMATVTSLAKAKGATTATATLKATGSLMAKVVPGVYFPAILHGLVRSTVTANTAFTLSILRLASRATIAAKSLSRMAPVANLTSAIGLRTFVEGFEKQLTQIKGVILSRFTSSAKAVGHAGLSATTTTAVHTRNFGVFTTKISGAVRSQAILAANSIGRVGLIAIGSVKTKIELTRTFAAATMSAFLTTRVIERGTFLGRVPLTSLITGAITVISSPTGAIGLLGSVTAGLQSSPAGSYLLGLVGALTAKAAESRANIVNYIDLVASIALGTKFVASLPITASLTGRVISVAQLYSRKYTLPLFSAVVLRTSLAMLSRILFFDPRFVTSGESRSNVTGKVNNETGNIEE